MHRNCFTRPASGALLKHGVKLGSVELDLPAMLADKDKAVTGLTGRHRVPLQEEQDRLAEGHATFTGAHTVDVAGKAVTAKNIVIATGSSVTPLPGVTVDNDKGVVVDSTGALSFAKVPERLVVIGGRRDRFWSLDRSGSGSAPR